MDCLDPNNRGGLGIDILFYQAYNPLIMLGSNTVINEIERKGKPDEEMTHDLLLNFKCPS
jgi:hypothetical protein